jgi:hypothetical protein
MRRLWILPLALAMLAGCSSGEIGTPCSGLASDEELCVEGAICTPDRTGGVEAPDPPNEAHTCRQLCDTEAECEEEGFECRRVHGSMLSACQPPASGE